MRPPVKHDELVAQLLEGTQICADCIQWLCQQRVNQSDIIVKVEVLIVDWAAENPKARPKNPIKETIIDRFRQGLLEYQAEDRGIGGFVPTLVTGLNNRAGNWVY
jgi:hypothetical protein